MSKYLKDYLQQISEVYDNKQRNYGQCTLIYKNQTYDILLILGPNYLTFFIAFILSFIFCILIFCYLYIQLMSKQQLILSLSFISIVVFLGTYFYMGISDPEIASKKQQSNLQIMSNYRYCELCKVVRNAELYHCYKCDVCINNYHHHCIWIGKCVGSKNINNFYFFIASFILVFFFLSLALFKIKAK